MPLPVYDLSGVDHIVSRQTDAGTASCSANVSVVQAMKTSRDCFVYEVHKGRKSTFVFAAAITSLRVLGAAHHLQANWFNTLTKLYKPRSHRAACPLYSALLKVSSGFTKASPYNDSIIAHTSVSACMMDLTTNEVFTLHYGSGSAAPWFESEGHAQPMQRSSRVHFVNGVEVHCGSQQLPGGQHTVIVGSSGLWSQIHPQKASMHARLFAATKGTIDSRDTPHDPATAVLRAALRTIVERFAPSKDARKAALFHIKQLDRLPRGSRSEEAGKGLIPRGRGDVHPDLTAIVLSLDTLAAAPSTPATPDSCRVKAWFRSSSLAKLHRHDDAASDCSASSASSLHEDSLDIFSIPAKPCASAEELYQELVSSRVLLFSAESSSLSCAGSSTPSTPRRGLIPRGPSLQSLTSRTTSAVDLSVNPQSEAQRRWRLLKLYVRGVLPAETALKATLWEGLLERAGRPVSEILCSRACLDISEALQGSESTFSGVTRGSNSSQSGATQQGFGPSPVSEGLRWNAVNPRMVY